MCASQFGCDVDMISRTTHRMCDPVHAADDATDVFMNALSCGWGQPWLAVLRAEHEMIVQRKMRRGYGTTSRTLPGCAIGREGGLRGRSGGSRSLRSLHHRLISVLPPGVPAQCQPEDRPPSPPPPLMARLLLHRQKLPFERQRRPCMKLSPGDFWKPS